MSKILELFGKSTVVDAHWRTIVEKQQCPFLYRKCLKNRKSQPEIAIGTCTVRYGRQEKDIIICPYRLLERKQVFMDCIHLLTRHEVGNEIHVLPELALPGGNVDYCLATVKSGKVKDFVGVELQTLDTTGTVWPERQRFLKRKGIHVRVADAASKRPFGMNWKMTAKTVLVQLHHKVQTFEAVNKHVALIIQDHFMNYMLEQFDFRGLSESPSIGDSMHFHVYSLTEGENHGLRLELAKRYSTDAAGIAHCLGLQAEPKVALEVITAALEAKISKDTLLNVDQTRPTQARRRRTGRGTNF
jgi:hypothetical protein